MDMQSYCLYLLPTAQVVHSLRFCLRTSHGRSHGGEIHGHFLLIVLCPTKLFWTFLMTNSQHELIHCVIEFYITHISLLIPQRNILSLNPAKSRLYCGHQPFSHAQQHKQLFVFGQTRSIVVTNTA